MPSPARTFLATYWSLASKGMEDKLFVVQSANREKNEKRRSVRAPGVAERDAPQLVQRALDAAGLTQPQTSQADARVHWPRLPHSRLKGGAGCQLRLPHSVQVFGRVRRETNNPPRLTRMRSTVSVTNCWVGTWSRRCGGGMRCEPTYCAGRRLGWLDQKCKKRNCTAPSANRETKHALCRLLTLDGARVLCGGRSTACGGGSSAGASAARGADERPRRRLHEPWRLLLLTCRPRTAHWRPRSLGSRCRCCCCSRRTSNGTAPWASRLAHGQRQR